MIVDQVIKLLSQQKKWTQGTCARNRKGETICPHVTRAYQWCVFGAFRKFEGKDSTCDDYANFQNWTLANKGTTPIDINDDKGYQSVMDLLKEYKDYLNG